jgi:hypothetical protein
MIAYAIDHQAPAVTTTRGVLTFDRSHHGGPSSEDASPRHCVTLDDAQEEALRGLCRGRQPLGDLADELGELGLATYERGRWWATDAAYALLGIRRRRPSFRMPPRGLHLGVLRVRAVRT